MAKKFYPNARQQWAALAPWRRKRAELYHQSEAAGGLADKRLAIAAKALEAVDTYRGDGHDEDYDADLLEALDGARVALAEIEACKSRSAIEKKRRLFARVRRRAWRDCAIA